MADSSLIVRPLPPLPEVALGDDIAALIVDVDEGLLSSDDVVVVSHKVVSKAEGSVIDLATITPSAQAEEIASDQDRDPRHVLSLIHI